MWKESLVARLKASQHLSVGTEERLGKLPWG